MGYIYANRWKRCHAEESEEKFGEDRRGAFGAAASQSSGWGGDVQEEGGDAGTLPEGKASTSKELSIFFRAERNSLWTCNQRLTARPLLHSHPITGFEGLIDQYFTGLFQNAAARRQYEHLWPVLRSLHKLPVAQRTDIETAVFMRKSLNGSTPLDISYMLVTNEPAGTLRSSGTDLLLMLPKNSMVKKDPSWAVFNPNPNVKKWQTFFWVILSQEEIYKCGSDETTII